MSTTVPTTLSTTGSFATSTNDPQSSDQLIVVVASLSCLGLFVMILLLVCHIYRKEPCCKTTSCEDTSENLEASSQYFNSIQSLVGPTCVDLPIEGYNNFNPESGQLFYVGMPSTYCIPPMDPNMPRLPSYESVRKKDRQREIHMMIADRFGLNGPMPTTELPPTYEESIRQAHQSIEVPFDAIPAGILQPDVDFQPPMIALPQNETLPQTPTSPGINYANNYFYPEPQAVVYPANILDQTCDDHHQMSDTNMEP
ncbi:uncharacterized protein si:ch73-364h19.1 [Trichomycterus rosablanca]|uniref:uncharacterized protein si:ch73-364h19.1 n=1 Tax=Trichomycterus rosablanca TaxID=2290929 RepID=UPI002F351955